MNRLIILGASGHGKVVADIAALSSYQDIVFLDNNRNIKECSGWPVIGPDSILPELDGDVFAAIGNAGIRKQLMERYAGRHFPVLIHPNAVTARDVRIGEGTVLMAGSVVNPGTVIGRGCIVNTCASVDHDCTVGDYCHIAVGAHLCGTVSLGDETWIGAGAVVSNNINVCGHSMIGAGAVVVRDIQEEGTYIGVPAARIQCR